MSLPLYSILTTKSYKMQGEGNRPLSLEGGEYQRICGRILKPPKGFKGVLLWIVILSPLNIIWGLHVRFGIIFVLTASFLSLLL